MANNGKSSWMKWLIVLVIIGGVGGALAWHFANREGDGPQYQTQAVTRGDIVQAVTATGSLQPVTNVTVGSQISGNIQKLYADWNSPVKAGQVVAQLDPSTYKAAVSQAEGELASANATLELNQIEAKRAEELYKAKLISDSDHDTALANLHQAQATVQIRQAALDTSKVNLQRCTIVSPVDGIVISRNVDVGQTVAASLSAPTLFVVANDLTKMEIDANVSEADVGGVEENQNVTFTVDAFPTRTFEGKVIQVRNAPTNYQNVVTYDCVISVDNRDMKLKPGMTANVSIVIAERMNALKVANSALRFHPPETASKDVKTNVTKMAAMTNGPGAEGTPGTRPEGGGNRPPGGRRGGGGGGPGGFGGGGGPGGGFRGGGGPGGFGGGAGGRIRAEHLPVRTVYIADKLNPSQLKAVQVKVGISDGVFTEVTDGLSEGDEVVTGLNLPSDQQTPSGPPSGNNPFGGGGGGTRGFRRM
jgi:HlyD family secretion protein